MTKRCGSDGMPVLLAPLAVLFALIAVPLCALNLRLASEQNHSNQKLSQAEGCTDVRACVHGRTDARMDRVTP